ncbi:immunity 22 family protein [Bacillus sp. XF8]|uniref:immunity 22 family protein n=1 Tax=Bacillus sp. XF8 TaxID=2819289 RepID=UPI001AA05AD2|nr:immunity 22 family protein [Bacillus sp. XF8]MBO1580126.1 immunity 22 family protein [Bacillus sp. XF8]
MNEKVSVWIGNFESKAELRGYINIEYTEDGDSISSIFEKNYNLDYYDRDLVEKKWISKPTNNIRDLLKGFSYSDQFIKQFDVINHEKEFNTAILVYNLEYDVQETKSKYNNNELEFIGVAQYTIVVDDRW